MSPCKEVFALSLLSCSRELLLCKVLSYWGVDGPPTLVEDVLQDYVPIYGQHGGSLFADMSYCALHYLLLYCRPGTADLVGESLFHSPSFLTVDEFSSLGVCFLGSGAQVNPEFRTRLKAYLASYRSPLLAAGAVYADSLFESTFGVASVLRHLHNLDEFTLSKFLVGLCRLGTPSTLRLFIDAGVDVNDYQGWENLLGNAAAVGNLEIVRMLMENGANTALGLTHFIYYSKELSDVLYKHLLELLVGNARPTSFKDVFYDALLAVLKSSRALLTHPEAPAILFRREVFSFQLLEWPCGEDCLCSYMCWAIRERLGSVVELLLQHGAYANTTSTWLIFSVECGAASCTEALIQHGADVDFRDGAGRSAIQLARSYMTVPHPRIINHFAWGFWEDRCEVTAEEDAETLAVVERTLGLKPQSTDDLKVHEPSCELEPRSLNEKGDAAPAPQNIFEKAFESLLTLYRHPLLGRHFRCRLDYKIDDLPSLSFYEALLMRFFYVLSYVILLALGILAFIRGDQRVRMPSRTVLSAVALLLLAFIWGPSLQTGLPLKSDTGRSIT